jgi:hypothetical protein
MLEYQNDDEIILSQDQIWESPPCDRHPAVCIDVVPVGEEEGEFYDKATGETKKTKSQKVWLVFQVFPLDGSRDSENKPFLIDTKLTASLGPQALLRLKLERWRGQIVNGKLQDRPFTNAELAGFNLAKLKGVPCWLSILPNGRFINVSDIEPYVDDQGKPITPAPTPDLTTYQRRKYRKKEKTTSTSENAPQTTTASATGGQASNDKSNWVPF